MTMIHPSQGHKVAADQLGPILTLLASPIHALAIVSAAPVAVGFGVVVVALFYHYLLGAPMNGGTSSPPRPVPAPGGASGSGSRLA
ncbi:hypothetical protein RAH32_15865 [Paracoccus sp. WLY502]|uniref:hypothetical protein n=1 Tax=Paracoccus yibinensis TaxID=3068891 RepID=UPI002796CF2A|nr:hypothetical protein [Paracoccus sp. WLY502]MDQ1901916.1 hypothetical protein [Paracoccus sp. WLY502]